MLVAAAGLGLAACENAPTYPIEPSIEVAGPIQRYRVSDDFGDRDSLVISLNWKDGDGDLGLSLDDTTGVYTARGRNRFYYNYFIQPYLLDQGRWTPINFGISYNGRFPRMPLANPDQKETLRGVLNYSAVKFPVGYFPRNAQVRFEISIADRALHESNTVTTDPVTLP
ncbi:hypothetical protein B0919_19535 [Hymenobacter sp. CRA2]|nr:hypothetical protein B0919_19535 [Hymenobacter sp. CRA2]